MSPGTTLSLAGSGTRRRQLWVTAGALLLGLVLLGAGLVTEGALAPTTLVGLVLVLVGLVLLTRVPTAVQRSDLTLLPDGVAWEGIGAPAWSAPWTDVRLVVLHRPGRRRALVAVELVVVDPDDPAGGPGEVRLAAPVTDPGARPLLLAALAQYAAGVPVEEAGRESGARLGRRSPDADASR